MLAKDTFTNELWNDGKDMISKLPTKKSAKIRKRTISETHFRAKGISDPVDDINYRKQNAKIQIFMRRDKENHIKEQCRKC